MRGRKLRTRLAALAVGTAPVVVVSNCDSVPIYWDDGCCEPDYCYDYYCSDVIFVDDDFDDDFLDDLEDIFDD